MVSNLLVKYITATICKLLKEVANYSKLEQLVKRKTLQIAYVFAIQRVAGDSVGIRTQDRTLCLSTSYILTALSGRKYTTNIVILV
jgi:hypothetical protein